MKKKCEWMGHRPITNEFYIGVFFPVLIKSHVKLINIHL